MIEYSFDCSLDILRIFSLERSVECSVLEHAPCNMLPFALSPRTKVLLSSEHCRSILSPRRQKPGGRTSDCQTVRSVWGIRPAWGSGLRGDLEYIGTERRRDCVGLATIRLVRPRHLLLLSSELLNLEASKSHFRSSSREPRRTERSVN